MLDSLIAFINKYITRNGNNEITGPVLNDVLIRIANILGSKVDKVEGKGLSTQDYTTADRNKLNGVEDGAQVNIINGVEVNGSALTPTPEGIIDIEIPVKVSELTNDKNYQTREDVELSVVGAKFNLADGIITFTRMNGTTFIIDLPTEMIVKSGYYDGDTGEIVLVLADNTEIRVPVSKLVNEYYGDNSTIELYSDSNDGYKFKFKISEAYKRKIDGSEQTANMVKTISESATDAQYPSAKAVWNSVKGLATNVQAFTQAGTRDEIKSGETISVIFGKIKKWLADLKAVAFSGSYNDLSNRPTIGNGTITITQNGATKGSFTTNQTDNATIDLSDENTTYGIGNASTAGLVKSDSSNVEIQRDGKMIARRADLADYAKYGVRGFKASKANSAIKYALFGVVGLPLSGETDLYFSCTIEVQGAASGASLLGKYNVFMHAKDDTTYNGQIGCVYTSNGVSDIIIGEVVRSSANSQGMLYLWANVSHLTTTQEAYNISIYGDINNDLEIRQNVHTTAIPYYSGVLINPELHVSKPTLDITDEGDSDVTDNTFILTSQTDGLATNKTIYRRPATFLWNYIKSKISSVLGLTASTYKGVADNSVNLGGTHYYRNNSGLYQLIGEFAIDYVAYHDKSCALLVQGLHNTNNGDTLLFNVSYSTNANSYAAATIVCSLGSVSDSNRINILYGELIQPTADKKGALKVYLKQYTHAYSGYQVSLLSNRENLFKRSGQYLYKSVLPAEGGTLISPIYRSYTPNDGGGYNIASTYRKLSGCLELTDSNLSTYFNSSTGALTIPNGVTTILFNTSSTKKVSNIVGTCAVNGYRLTIAGQWLPVQKTSSSTTGCFSSYIYGYRAGASGTSFDGATNRLTEAFEDFIYFNGVWYSKAY